MGLSRNLSLILGKFLKPSWTSVLNTLQPGGATAITYMFASFIPLWVRKIPLFIL